MSEPVFTIKKETLPAHLNGVRISSRVFQAIAKLCRENGVSQGEVVRQMLDFAIEHMPADGSEK